MDFKLLMIFVDQDRTDRVLDAARQAGATGATIINNAQGQGLSPTSPSSAWSSWPRAA
ncbi:hypothetical protein [Halomonas sp. BM-2019]|uniref:hypothetical protein n=1 Tax=Halomonas sp. BM-2019 TaxID=2811227 RepID=UPI001B3C3F29|nr:MAG: hypothetical protein J5F18_13950 [Halomonas sp. BM-2019]